MKNDFLLKLYYDYKDNNLPNDANLKKKTKISTPFDIKKEKLKNKLKNLLKDNSYLVDEFENVINCICQLRIEREALDSINFGLKLGIDVKTAFLN